ncbi:hypothetical protein JCM8547_002731 [Rhodosporidiobolus lusitaniae]
MPADKSAAPKTRSRTGCLTCRGRHKKCSSDGAPPDGSSCDRCRRGGWECVWPDPAKARPLKRFVKKAATAQAEPSGRKASLSNSDGDGASSSADLFTSIPVDAPPEAAAPTVLPLPPASAVLGFPIPPFPPTPTGPPFTALPYVPTYPSPTSVYPTLPPPPPAAPPFTAAPARRPSTAQSPLLSSTTLAPAHAPTPGASLGLTPAASASNPYADLDLLVPTPQLSLKPGEDLSDFFTSLDAELGSWEFGTAGTGSVEGNSPTFSLSLTGSAGETGQTSMNGGVEEYSPRAINLLGLSSTTTTGASPPLVTVARARADSLAVMNEKESPGAGSQASPAGDGTEPKWLDPVYDTFNNGFFRSLPKPVRDVVCKNVYNVVVSSELSRNAGMAMVMLYRLRTQQQQIQEENSDPAVVAEQQAKLLAQSNKFFQRALEHIQTPIPFEAKMVAVLDMQNYQYDQWGAAAANAIVLLGEYFVNEELGLQPLLDLTSASVLLSTFAWTDCIRCICIPGRRTVFTYSHLPGDPNPEATSTLISDVSAQQSDLSVHLGLPVGLMLCISATTNLAAEAEALPDEVVRVKAAAIEKAARGWRPPPPDPQDLADGAAYLEKLSSAEMWRHAIIIFLYQVVHKHGSLSKVIREAKQQIVSIGSGLLSRQSQTAPHPPFTSSSTSTNNAGATSSSSTKDEYLNTSADRAVPWFLAGTVATLPTDRVLCKKGLEACGPLQGYRDNIVALERIWEVVDERGWGVDWRAMLQNEKQFVGFL